MFSFLFCQPPKPPRVWGPNTRDASQLSPACLQILQTLEYIQQHRPLFNTTSEDCLYLNIYVPITKVISCLHLNALDYLADKCHWHGLYIIWPNSYLRHIYDLFDLVFIIFHDRSSGRLFGLIRLFYTRINWVRQYEILIYKLSLSYLGSD